MERVSGLSLNDYFQKNIFAPMGLKNINMFPTQHMKDNLAYMNARAPDGKLSLRPAGQLNRAPLMVRNAEEVKRVFNAGGAGCFAKPREYLQVIATLLNDGTHPGTGSKILKPETVKEMFTNQIPEMPDFGRQGIDNPKSDLTNALPDLYPQPGEAQGWGLTFFLHLGGQLPTGRSNTTGWWAGLPNLFWWADREQGLGGMIASQIVPFGGKLCQRLLAQTKANYKQMRLLWAYGERSKQVCIKRSRHDVEVAVIRAAKVRPIHILTSQVVEIFFKLTYVRPLIVKVKSSTSTSSVQCSRPLVPLRLQ